MQSRSDSISKVKRSGERKNFPQRNTPASTGERRELRLRVTRKGAKYDRYVETNDRNGRALVSATRAARGRDRRVSSARRSRHRQDPGHPTVLGADRRTPSTGSVCLLRPGCRVHYKLLQTRTTHHIHSARFHVTLSF